MELARIRLRKRGGGGGQRQSGAGRKAWGGRVCRDRYSAEVGAGDVSVGLQGFAGLDCVGGQMGGADMGDTVCTSHVNRFMSMHWPRRCRLCWSERPSAAVSPASNPNRTSATVASGSFKSSSWNIMPGPGRPFFTLNACEPGKHTSTNLGRAIWGAPGVLYLS